MFLYIIIGLILIGLVLTIRLQIRNIIYVIRSKKKVKGENDEKS